MMRPTCTPRNFTGLPSRSSPTCAKTAIDLRLLLAPGLAAQPEGADDQHHDRSDHHDPHRDLVLQLHPRLRRVTVAALISSAPLHPPCSTSSGFPSTNPRTIGVLRVPDLVRRPLLDHPPLVEHRDPVADAVRAPHVVGDDQATSPPAPASSSGSAGRSPWWSPGRARWWARRRGGTWGGRRWRAPAPRASAARPRAPRGGASRTPPAPPGQRLGDALADLLLRVPALLDEPHRQVLGDRHRVEEGGELEDVPHLPPQLVELLARERGDLLSVHPHRCPSRAQGAPRCASASPTCPRRRSPRAPPCAPPPPQSEKPLSTRFGPKALWTSTQLDH